MTRQPDDAAFADLVAASWPGLYRAAYLLVGDHQLAEDLAQAALATTYASWGRIRDPQAAPAYARRVLATTAASWFRRRGWRAERPVDVLPETAAEDDDVTSRPVLMQALARLPPRQRAVVVLRFYEDLSVRETADVLGVSEGTVKAQTSDALARLRPLLGDVVIPTLEGRP